MKARKPRTPGGDALRKAAKLLARAADKLDADLVDLRERQLRGGSNPDFATRAAIALSHARDLRGEQVSAELDADSIEKWIELLAFLNALEREARS